MFFRLSNLAQFFTCAALQISKQYSAYNNWTLSRMVYNLATPINMRGRDGNPIYTSFMHPIQFLFYSPSAWCGPPPPKPLTLALPLQLEAPWNGLTLSTKDPSISFLSWSCRGPAMEQLLVGWARARTHAHTQKGQQSNPFQNGPSSHTGWRQRPIIETWQH